MLERISTFISYLVPEGLDRGCALMGGFLGGAFYFLFGDQALMVYWLAIAVATDYITGHMAALIKCEWESCVAFRGLIKKGLIFLVVALFHGLDIVFEPAVGQSNAFLCIAVWSCMAMEIGSIFENLDRGGFGGAVPEVLRKALKKIQYELNNKFKEPKDNE